jgi:hypothetical protein
MCSPMLYKDIVWLARTCGEELWRNQVLKMQLGPCKYIEKAIKSSKRNQVPILGTPARSSGAGRGHGRRRSAGRGRGRRRSAGSGRRWSWPEEFGGFRPPLVLAPVEDGGAGRRSSCRVGCRSRPWRPWLGTRTARQAHGGRAWRRGRSAKLWPARHGWSGTAGAARGRGGSARSRGWREAMAGGVRRRRWWRRCGHR